MAQILTFYLCSLLFQNNEHQLIIKIENIQDHSGVIKIAVFDNEESHLKNSIRHGEFTVTDQNTLLCTFLLPYGEYSFTLYQDVDSNGKLNTNFIGIPNEPYAFSNNASILFGPPSYDKCKFKFKKDQQIASVELK